MTMIPFSLGPGGVPSGATTAASVPASGVADEPGLTGGWAKPDHPASHGDDVDLIAAVRVDGELRRRGRATRRENEGRLVRLQFHVAAVVALVALEQLGPREVARPLQRRATRLPLEDDHMLDSTGI